MATDVLLDDKDGDWITINAAVVCTTASDVMIDNPDRHMPDSPDYRRALVHNELDGLTVNFSDDYPGGLTLDGVVRILAKEVVRGELPDLTPPPKKIPWDVWEGIGGKLQVQEATIMTAGTSDPRYPHVPSLKIEGGIEFTWNYGGVSLTEESSRVNLQSILEDLRAQILELQSRVEALGG